jgi:hypothetical protein
MDIVQKLLLIVVVALTVLLLVVGVQIYTFVRDLRRALKKINAILDDSILGGGLIRPEKLTSILQMFRKNKGVEKKGEGEIN